MEEEGENDEPEARGAHSHDQGCWNSLLTTPTTSVELPVARNCTKSRKGSEIQKQLDDEDDNDDEEEEGWFACLLVCWLLVASSLLNSLCCCACFLDTFSLVDDNLMYVEPLCTIFTPGLCTCCLYGKQAFSNVFPGIPESRRMTQSQLTRSPLRPIQPCSRFPPLRREIRVLMIH
jgi:hypothetical protein